MAHRAGRTPAEDFRVIWRDSRAQALAQAVQVARGRYVLAVYGSATAVLADPALIEKALRILRANPQIAALAFAEG